MECADTDDDIHLAADVFRVCDRSLKPGDYHGVEMHAKTNSKTPTCVVELAPSCSLDDPSGQGYLLGVVAPSDLVAFERSVMGMCTQPSGLSQNLGPRSETTWSKMFDTG